MSIPPPVMTPAGLEATFDLVTYYPLLLFMAVIVVQAFVMLTLTHLGWFLPFLKPQKPTRVKQMPYESGMDPIGTSRMQFDIKFYVLAILFLVFDVELLFLYPWAVIAYSTGGDLYWRNQLGLVVFFEILVFLATLGIAYVYAWQKGVFRWR